MRIGKVEIGRRIFIIAEVGSNHNGDFAIARQLVVEAARAGADAVKFQVYRAEKLVSRDLPVMSHVQGQHRTQRERFKSLEFSASQWAELAAVADSTGILFFASVFDEDSADLIDPFVPVFKIASGDLTHLPLLRHVAKKGKPVILSTGMATEDEIAEALDMLASEQVILLHCVSRYPTPPEEANLRSIEFMRDRFRIPVGYSDHMIGNIACVAAAAMGASVIEKHFTLDNTLPFGDHRLSATPGELATLVDSIRQVEAVRGEYKKDPGEAERRMKVPMRRSLHARTEIPKGTVLAAEHVIALRPGTDLAPKNVDRLIGRRARRTIPAETILQLEDFETG